MRLTKLEIAIYLAAALGVGVFVAWAGLGWGWALALVLALGLVVTYRALAAENAALRKMVRDMGGPDDSLLTLEIESRLEDAKAGR